MPSGQTFPVVSVDQSEVEQQQQQEVAVAERDVVQEQPSYETTAKEQIATQQEHFFHEIEASFLIKFYNLDRSPKFDLARLFYIPYQKSCDLKPQTFKEWRI